MFKTGIGKSPCFLNEKITIVVKGKLTTNERLSSNWQQGNKKTISNYFAFSSFFDSKSKSTKNFPSTMFSITPDFFA